MFKLKTTLAWRQLKGKKEYVIGKFMDEEMEQYVHKLYMRDGIMPMTLSIETTYTTCIYLRC